MTFRDNGRILERMREQAVPDPLTGLGNRRQLISDLERALEDRLDSSPRLLVIFDLEGFEQYKDTFGDPAGDALLARLGTNLAGVAAPLGRCYRLGGHEFCVLAALPANGDVDGFVERCVETLTEEGEALLVTTRYGEAFLPDDAATATEALRVADRRLSAQKHAASIGRGRPHEVLLQALFEREPTLRAHVRHVAGLAARIGRLLRIDQQELEELRLAGELHDVGKLAIPDSVLRKPGPLSVDEWTLIHQHTVIGQRILSAAPALHRIGAIVRATHERWDGTGYPDRLAAQEIPLAARIIAVCDAYTAMVSKRTYRLPVTVEAACAELRRCAGTHFDPVVVELLVTELERSTKLQSVAGSVGT